MLDLRTIAINQSKTQTGVILITENESEVVVFQYNPTSLGGAELRSAAAAVIDRPTFT